jgi:acyl dehydratase
MDYTAHERIRLMPIGELVGLSDWLTITQTMISEFGAVTQDPDPMHLDPEWAARNGPFGGTIAYGFLTLSLLTTLFNSAVGDPPSRDRHSHGAYVNYGLGRTRFVTPVLARARIRGRFVLAERREDELGRLIMTVAATIEIEGEARPALVGEWLFAWIPPDA